MNIKLVTIDGETHSITEWLKIKGFTKQALHARLKAMPGLTIEQALCIPKKSTNKPTDPRVAS